jgi:predicted signal transduction protein with EAL and GGDEF domain
MLAQAEALVRLRGGSGQAVPPDSFLPVAERTDLILLHDPRIGLLVRGFVRMVQELGLRVVAEGIETLPSGMPCWRWAAASARAGCSAGRVRPGTWRRSQRSPALPSEEQRLAVGGP